MSYPFPMNVAMEGSVIPGIGYRFAGSKVVTYPDFTNSEFLKSGRTEGVDPLQSPVPDMNQPHTGSMLEKLKALMAGQAAQAPGSSRDRQLQDRGNRKSTDEFFRRMGEAFRPKPKPVLREGYERVRENLDWRKQ